MYNKINLNPAKCRAEQIESKGIVKFLHMEKHPAVVYGEGPAVVYAETLFVFYRLVRKILIKYGNILIKRVKNKMIFSHNPFIR